MKDKLFRFLNWIISIILLMICIPMLITSVIAGIIMLIVILLINPLSKSKVEKYIKRPIKSKYKIIICVFGFILSMVIMVNVEESRVNKQEQPKIVVINNLLEKGNISDAQPVINELRNSKNQNIINAITNIDMTIIDMTINESDSIDKAKKVLKNMSNEEFQLLQRDKLNKNYYDIEFFNNRFIKTLKKVENQRTFLLKEKADEEEKARLAAEEAEKKRKMDEEKARLVVQKEARKKSINNQFSAWDGSHIKLEQYIKENMNDPKSYDHDETIYWDMKDHLIVSTTFRGKNAFGGIVKSSVKAKVSINGDILQILEYFN